MSAELRMSLVYALTNPEEFSNEVNQVEMRNSESTYAGFDHVYGRLLATRTH